MVECLRVMTEHESDLQRLFNARSFKDADYTAEEIEDFKEDLDCLRTHYDSYMASNLYVPFEELPADVQQWLDEVYSDGTTQSCLPDAPRLQSFWQEMLTGLRFIFAIVTVFNLIIIAIRFALK